jgi:chitodextrinase
LTATAVSASQIDLSWTAASDPESGVASYKVYRNGTVVATPTGTSFSDTGLAGSTSYTYQVSAVNGAGLEGPKSASASTTTPDGTPPTAPANLRAQVYGLLQTWRVDLTWTAASDPESGVASYKVYRNGTVIGTATGTTFSDPNVMPLATYSYRVSAVNRVNMEGPQSNTATVQIPLLKPALSGALPFELRQNHPNPFNPSTTIRYALPEAARVRLAVYNALGQQVRVLVDAEQEPGAHSAVWDGRDDSGRAVSAGLYLYRLEAGPRQVIRKMLLAR